MSLRARWKREPLALTHILTIRRGEGKTRGEAARVPLFWAVQCCLSARPAGGEVRFDAPRPGAAPGIFFDTSFTTQQRPESLLYTPL